MGKQIDEIIKLLCTLCAEKDYCADTSGCTIEDYAKLLYEGGYRKQREGKWIKRISAYVCSECGAEISIGGFAVDSDPIDDFGLCFCCNCGAMMEGTEDGNS